MGDETENLVPAHTYVPWVTFNHVSNEHRFALKRSVKFNNEMPFINRLC